MLRREFIRLASFTAGALTFSGPAMLHADGDSNASLSGDDLYKLFLDAPNQYRPMVRWWWNGDRIRVDELLRELDILQQASIGGVEINPIRFPSDADPLDTKPLIWMSDEWIAALKAVMDGAKQRGMVCDMIVGSGWPYGGEFLTREDQTQMMALGTRDIQGPAHIRLTSQELLADVQPHLVSAYKDPLKELISASLVPHELSTTEQATSITWDKSKNVLEFDVPEGQHVLYFLVKLTGYMAVINGAPGASGPVLNHYNGPAVSRYLDRISDRLTDKLGPLHSQLRAFFTDSIELEGANWCDDMLQQFQQRRGYDLAPYLPFVLFKVGEMGNAVSTPYGANFTLEFKEKTERVRYDFETTKRELFNERFVATFVAWCRKIGVKSRMQAYGMECDAISAGMMVDIPECETWIHSEEIESFGTGSYIHGRNYSMINKFVSSAAHLSGKRLISCEEMTNTEDPFHTTMERIKLAGDQSMLSGVTQSVLHGFNYSPLAAPFPGWVRYGTFFNERNTWWPYFHLWTMYKARLSALFQMCEMQADIAILPPQADLASKYGFQRDPFPKIAYPEYLFKIWEAIHQNGSGCDYLSEEVIAQSSIKDGKLRFRTRSYKAILLPRVESLHPATAEKLQTFVEGGGVLVFLDTVPHLSDGLMHQEADSRTVEDLFTAMRSKFPERTPQLSVREEDMVGWFREVQQSFSLKPDVSISEPKDYVSQLHYRNGDQSIFFFTHYGPEDRHTFQAHFPEEKKSAWRWNPETGERSRLQRNISDGSLTISLGPSESQLIVFETSRAKTIPHTVELSYPIADRKETASEPLQGPWKVRLQHVDGTDRTITLDKLIDFNEREDLKSFAGTITYSQSFSTGSKTPQWLSLGRVRSISEVSLNGHALGVRWYGEHVYPMAKAVRRGQNAISIKVVTTLGDYMKTLKNNRTAMDWTSYTPSYPLGLIHTPELIVD
ncbi:MAG: glycosyl hydrolase [Edaphobacter sp.]|uniref:glycosyl hydrolase n=1 Tax=Edaphobacter sp. TaxID=1934404 RepID=UPI0023A56194|nr:glycosyl hydrolase [Edaphobacter sp.]MDE1177460.1 glycosyl hydrolase [Edaphobacter sp.]